MSRGASLRSDKIWADDEHSWYQSLTQPPQEDHCHVDGGKREFTRFLQPISRQEMMIMLVAEPTLFQQRQTQISCCSLCLRGAIKRPHQWVWLKYDTKNIAGPPQALHYMRVEESALFWFLTWASMTDKCFIGQRNCSFYGLQTFDRFRNCLFPTSFYNHSVLINVKLGLTF